MSTLAPPRRTTRYTVGGMTCGGCVAGVRTKLEALPEVERADVDLDTGTAELALRQPVDVTKLQAALGEGKYVIAEDEARAGAAAPKTVSPPAGAVPAEHESTEPGRSWLATYRPLLTIVGLIALTTVLAQAPFADGLDGTLWMRHFMAGFFIVFAGFKLLDVRGFADGYAMYDVIAQRWRGWGLVYPFVELGLGLAYLTDVAPYWTNVATIVVLGISAIGVIRSVLDRRAIKCACLGTGFDLPMTTVTIVEDVGMVAMAAAMLLG